MDPIAPEDHQRWIAILATCALDTLQSVWDALAPKPDYRLLRPIEIGMVLLRGRISGSGAAFNFGEATMTRAAVELASGERGFSYLLGRKPAVAELAAVMHALLQRPSHRHDLETRLLAPALAAKEAKAAAARAAAAATRVDFSTLARGDA